MSLDISFDVQPLLHAAYEEGLESQNWYFVSTVMLHELDAAY